ncbi:MAG: FAD-dependent oxidoreductase, partial [Oscillospiraceae bacterium]|nr:FAD-dependent oxidoreductase [Oscillospiraceae bacterium]
MTEFNCDALVVGCGISGAVIARYLAEEKGNKVIVVDRRAHIAGNMYDFRNENGIIIQKYGPHAFHTKKEKLFEYMKRYSEWKRYELTCMVQMNGKFTPSPFNYQTVDDFYPPEKAEELKKHIRAKYGDAEKTTIVEMLGSDDPLIKEYADFLFDNDYSLYTAKQWGISPSEIDVSVLKRVPVLFSYKNGYFDDEFQAMPKNGFTELLSNILCHENIDICLNTDALEFLSVSDGKLLLNGEPTDKTVIYTGAADELLGCKYGVLPYRSLRFEYKT